MKTYHLGHMLQEQPGPPIQGQSLKLLHATSFCKTLCRFLKEEGIAAYEQMYCTRAALGKLSASDGLIVFYTLVVFRENPKATPQHIWELVWSM